MIDRENILIIFPYFCLLFIGLVMVASSSVYVSEDLYGTPFHFASRQVIFLILGIFATIIALSIPSNLFLTLDWLILIGSLLLLIALFFPGVGTEVNGSLRWIRIGPINIQPSEVSKLALVIYISGYCVRRLSEINTSLGFFRPLIVLALFGLLIMSQPDLGSTLVIGALVIAVLFFAGISFLSMSGDKDYNQAPNTAVITAKEMVKKYDTAAVFASGMVVDALKCFRNLWDACMTAKGFGEDLSLDDSENAMKRDWVRRFENFANNYLNGDPTKAEHCLKDAYLLHKWNKIQKNLKPIEWKDDLTAKKYVDVDTLAAAACAGGACEIDF